MKSETSFSSNFEGHLRVCFDMMVQNLTSFWASSSYRHFTNHGRLHSERVHKQKLVELAHRLPEQGHLTQEEAFVVASAAWLYEIGMQSPCLYPILPFECEPGKPLSVAQLQQIRAKKHLLSEQLIIDGGCQTAGKRWLLHGPIVQPNEYTQLIAYVCRSCSNEPLDQVVENQHVRSHPVRMRLLVALLRLANQLYLDSSRINWDLLESPELTADVSLDLLTYWWMHMYVTILPMTTSQILFFYTLPDSQREYLGHIRSFVESSFDYSKNAEIRFLFDNGLPISINRKPAVCYHQSNPFVRPMPLNVQRYLCDTVVPLDDVSSLC